MMRVLVLSVLLFFVAITNALATYGGFFLDELISKSDIVALVRRTGPETMVGKKPARLRVVLEIKDVWKGRNLPKQILAEYELGEGVPLVGPFGTDRDFVAFLSRVPARKQAEIPTYEFKLGTDAALLVPTVDDLRAAKNLVEAPTRMRSEGQRFLDLGWVKKHVQQLAHDEKPGPVPEPSGKADGSRQ